MTVCRQTVVFLFSNVVPDVEELRDGEGPVERELHHVVHPDLRRHGVVRIVVPKYREIEV